jgi:hypothetical protein
LYVSHSGREIAIQKGSLKDSDRLNDEYWAAIPNRERLAMVWDLVRELNAWRTPDAAQSRLQRSVLNVQRR